MTDREWALERLRELHDIRKTDLAADVECVDLIGSLSRMKRVPNTSGMWHNAYRRIHDWRLDPIGMAKSRMDNPGLMKLYAQLRQ